MWVIFGAVLLIWNLTATPIAVLVDGVIQCTVASEHACRVRDVPEGHHLVNTPEAGPDAVQRGVAGESQIEMQASNPTKICAQEAYDKGTTGICDRWLKDQPGTGPLANRTSEVPYQR